MLENLLVTFTEGQEPKCETPMPVIFGQETCRTIFHNQPKSSSYKAYLCKKDGEIVEDASVELGYEDEYVDIDIAKTFTGYIEDGECVHVKIKPTEGQLILEEETYYVGPAYGATYKDGYWTQELDIQINYGETSIVELNNVSISIPTQTGISFFGIRPIGGRVGYNKKTNKYRLAGNATKGTMRVEVVFKSDNGSPLWSSSFTLSGTEVYGSHLLTSNTLIKMEKQEDCSVLVYQCNEDALGIPFGQTGTDIVQLVPIFLKKPQYTQDDKTYTTANGRVMVLYAKYYKEWDAETEYLPETIHDKIIAALSCDIVAIKNQEILGTDEFVTITKSGNYEVDWENKTETECGTKIARATFKVKANTMNRNTNYF